MIVEESLRRQLQPTVDRRRHLLLAWRLTLVWFVTALAGLAVAGLQSLLGWRSDVPAWLVVGAAVMATLVAIRKARKAEPDYRQIARTIESTHPELQALLLAAVEQRPQGPERGLGYLQRQVLKEAMAHAAGHDWMESISSRRLMWADLGAIVTGILLAAVVLQVIPSTSPRAGGRGAAAARGQQRVTVTPGDTVVESASPVVIVARFDGPVPSAVTLRFGPAGQPPQTMALDRTLEDPVFGGVLRDVRTDLVYSVEYGGHRTRDYHIRVMEPPSLTRADARIVYPSYTNRPEKVLRDTRQVVVVEGSHVTWTLTLNKPVASARLVPRQGDALDLTADANSPAVYRVSLTADQSQRYELRLTDADGRTNKVPERLAVDVHKNLPPELRVVFPRRDTQVSPLEELSLEAEVTDDFGVTGYGLTYTLVGTDSRDLALGGAAASREKQRISTMFSMEGFKAQPGQLLTYSFWAEDIGPDGQVRRTRSDLYFAEVRPFEEIFRESQSFQDERNPQQDQQGQDGQQGRQPEQLARLQKQIIAATWNLKQRLDRAGATEESRKDLDVVRQSQSDVLDDAKAAQAAAEQPSAAKALGAAGQYMQTSLDHLTRANPSASTDELAQALGTEQSAYQELLKLRDSQVQVAQGARNSTRRGNRSADFEQRLQQLELQQRENRYETERLAQSQQQSASREDLQVLSRLGDLARRQEDVAGRLREAEASLRQARSDQEREEILRELKRLRDEQLQALQDVDELQNRMERPENRQRMSDARQQVGDTRSRISQSTEDLEQGRISDAVNSTTRAQRQLEQTREDLRRSTSGQFVQEMRQMRDEAQQLDERQRQISDDITQQAESGQKTLTDSDAAKDLVGRVSQQKERALVLMDRMKSVSEQSETSEPLLSEKLYDTLRKANTSGVDKALETTSELLRRHFLPQAQEMDRQAGAGIQELRKGVEEASQGVLGDEAQALARARRQLDDLVRQVDEEAGRARDQQARSGGGRAVADANADPNGAGGRSVAGGRSQEPGQQGQPGATGEGPLTGGAYRAWSDTLREVEEVLSEEDLRNQAARVRDQARAIRQEFTRRGRPPQWDLVQQQISRPLAELRTRLDERLARLRSSEALAPIDRDPVPGRYAEPVRRYFENLGGQQ
jgi:hypothetical protein